MKRRIVLGVDLEYARELQFEYDDRILFRSEDGALNDRVAWSTNTRNSLVRLLRALDKDTAWVFTLKNKDDDTVYTAQVYCWNKPTQYIETRFNIESFVAYVCFFVLEFKEKRNVRDFIVLRREASRTYTVLAQAPQEGTTDAKEAGQDIGQHEQASVVPHNAKQRQASRGERNGSVAHRKARKGSRHTVGTK